MISVKRTLAILTILLSFVAAAETHDVVVSGRSTLCDDKAKSKALSKPALVLRFDDNKPPAQWREIAEIFEAANGRCSLAVNAAKLKANGIRLTTYSHIAD